MTEETLYTKLLKDLEKINMPINEVDIKIRPFSKTYFGRYFPDRKTIYVYPYEENGTFMSYCDIFLTVVHEMVHHIQHQDPNFKRLYGVMHNPQFWKLYNHFLDRAIRLNIVELMEVEKCQCIAQKENIRLSGYCF